MKILDTNVLLYAVNRDHEHHERVARWLESTVNDGETTGIPWIVLSGFVRIAINASIFDNPLSAKQAFDLVDAWLAAPTVRVVSETGRHARRFRELLLEIGGGSSTSTDAHIAAIALEHRAVLATCDHDFRRFPGLKVENPLES